MTDRDDGVGTRIWFERYIDAFNASDFAGFGGYYADDVRFFGQAGSFEGAAAVLAFYRTVKARASETLELLTFVGTADHVAAEIRTTLAAREDWPDMPTGAMAKGDTRQSVNFIFYDIVEGRFARVRSARFARGQG